jgi:hypothetical protein
VFVSKGGVVFIQVIQGRAVNPGAISEEMDRWRAELEPGAEGWLGSTSGTTEDGEYIAVVRFDSMESARRNSQRPEQGAWWERVAPNLRDVVFHDSSRVHTYKDGGSDDAGFVQVIQGHSDDMERLAELGRAQEKGMMEQAPHILGMTVAEHADKPGDFTQTVYFTTEDEARRMEREMPASSDPRFAEMMSLMGDLRYLDLRHPRLDSRSM